MKKFLSIGLIINSFLFMVFICFYVQLNRYEFIVVTNKIGYVSNNQVYKFDRLENKAQLLNK